MEYGPGALYARIIKNFADASLGRSGDDAGGGGSSSSNRDASAKSSTRLQDEWTRRLEEAFDPAGVFAPATGGAR